MFYKTFSEGLIPTQDLYLRDAEVIDFFQNFVVPSKNLTERFEAFYASSYNKNYGCGVC